jgi:hypothetical protein
MTLLGMPSSQGSDPLDDFVRRLPKWKSPQTILMIVFFSSQVFFLTGTDEVSFETGEMH